MEKFESLSEEKQNRILNAAMAVFSRDGYKKASTNEIIREAGISKGILFHYFGSKQALFQYLYAYVINETKRQLLEKVDLTVLDPLDRIHDVVHYKFTLLRTHPSIFDFAKAAYYEKDLEVAPFIRDFNTQTLESSYAAVFQGIDYSRFRPELNPGMILHTITATLESFSIGYMDLHKSEPVGDLKEDEIMGSIDGYLEFFKKTFYK